MRTEGVDDRILLAIRIGARVRVLSDDGYVSEAIEGVARHVLDDDAISYSRRPWSDADCLIVREGSHEYGVPLAHIVAFEILSAERG